MAEETFFYRVGVDIKCGCLGFIKEALKANESIHENADFCYYECSDLNSVASSVDVRTIAETRFGIINELVYYRHGISDALTITVVKKSKDFETSLHVEICATDIAALMVVDSATCFIGNEKGELVEQKKTDILSKYLEKYPIVRYVLRKLNEKSTDFNTQRFAIEIMFKEDDPFRTIVEKEQEYKDWRACIHRSKYAGSRAVHFAKNAGQVPVKIFTVPEMEAYPRTVFERWVRRKSI